MTGGESLATLGVALACVVALGTLATTMPSSVSTHPDDVIDLDYKELPIGRDRAQDLKEQYQGDTADEDGNPGSVPSSADDSPASSSEGSRPSSKDQGSGGGSSSPSGSEGQAGSPGPGEDTGIGPGSGYDWMADLLRTLLALVALAVLVVGAYRYRDRLAALFAALLPATEAATDSGTDREQWDPGSPSNPVHAAWVELLRRTDLDDPHARTPEECREAAIDAGLDPDAVRTLTRVFRDVRYGERPVTDDRVRRANDSLERIDRGEGV